MPRPLLVEIRGIEEEFQVALPGPGCASKVAVKGGTSNEKQHLTGWNGKSSDSGSRMVESLETDVFFSWVSSLLLGT